jgi:hypothetical protein
MLSAIAVVGQVLANFYNKTTSALHSANNFAFLLVKNLK